MHKQMHGSLRRLAFKAWPLVVPPRKLRLVQGAAAAASGAAVGSAQQAANGAALGAAAAAAGKGSASSGELGPMGRDCKIVHGKVPGPANHVLCATHGHVLDTAARMVIARSVTEYVKARAAGGAAEKGAAVAAGGAAASGQSNAPA